MGLYIFDQYSLLHYAVGVMAYFWNISLLYTVIIHTVFEYTENTKQGMYFINHYFKNIWPGGKPRSDTYINIIGDTIATVVGWYSAHLLDKYSKEKHLYFD
jgi:hypothetical protein